MLKKTVLDYRYGHYALLGLTEDFVFVYDVIKGTVSDYFLVNVDYELGSTAAQTLDCVHRWSEADKLRFAPQISRLKAHVRACYSLITQPVMCSVNQNRKTRPTTVSRQHVPIHSAPDVSTGTCDP